MVLVFVFTVTFEQINASMMNKSEYFFGKKQMFKLRNSKMLCTKWAHFKYDARYRSQNSWHGGMFTMVQHLLFFLKQFEDVWSSRLCFSGVLLLEFGPILAWYRFPAAKECVVLFDVFFV